MRKERTLEDVQLQPTEAFLYTLDRAVTMTADLLRQAGFDEECIWGALEKSLALLARTTAEIDEIKPPAPVAPLPARMKRAPERAHLESLPVGTASAIFH
jgi:hypothetical protein